MANDPFTDPNSYLAYKLSSTGDLRDTRKDPVPGTGATVVQLAVGILVACVIAVFFTFL